MPNLAAAESALTKLITRELLSLRIPPSLLGFHFAVFAVERIADDPMRIRGLTKDLYEEVAGYYNTTAEAVERNIRTAVSACWNRGGGEVLSRMANHPFEEKPCASEFLALMAAHVDALR